MVEGSAILWMDWLCPEDLMTCTLVSKSLYVTAHCDVLWVRHRDALLKHCPSLYALFFEKSNAQKRRRYNQIQLDTSTQDPWVRPKGIWSVFMKLSGRMYDALFGYCEKNANTYILAYLEFIMGPHAYTIVERGKYLVRGHVVGSKLRWRIRLNGGIIFGLYATDTGRQVSILPQTLDFDVFIRIGPSNVHLNYADRFAAYKL